MKSSFEELEKRLLAFAIMNLNIAEKINNSFAGRHLKNQLIRSGTSPALNYAEARYAESKKDFIHKIKIILKELQETKVCLQIISSTSYYSGKFNILSALKECNELIYIFTASINTVRKRIKEKP